MQKLSVIAANNFLKKHFKLFLEKKLEEGFSYHIQLSGKSEKNQIDYFFGNSAIMKVVRKITKLSAGKKIY